MYQDVQAVDKEVRDENIDKITEDITAFVTEKHGEEFAEERKQEIGEIIYKLEKKCVIKMIY